VCATSNVAADAVGFVDFEDAETWSNAAHAGESEDAKPVKVGVRAVSGEQIAEIKVDVDASMGQFFAKLRAQQFDSDELKQFEKQGSLVFLTPASLEVFGECMWWMWDMYCRPMNCRCVKAEVNANRPLIFQVILTWTSDNHTCMDE
jgi:hypothetical protein